MLKGKAWVNKVEGENTVGSVIVLILGFSPVKCEKFELLTDGSQCSVRETLS